MLLVYLAIVWASIVDVGESSKAGFVLPKRHDHCSLFSKEDFRRSAIAQLHHQVKKITTFAGPEIIPKVSVQIHFEAGSLFLSQRALIPCAAEFNFNRLMAICLEVVLNRNLFYFCEFHFNLVIYQIVNAV